MNASTVSKDRTFPRPTSCLAAMVSKCGANGSNGGAFSAVTQINITRKASDTGGHLLASPTASSFLIASTIRARMTAFAGWFHPLQNRECGPGTTGFFWRQRLAVASRPGQLCRAAYLNAFGETGTGRMVQIGDGKPQGRPASEYHLVPRFPASGRRRSAARSSLRQPPRRFRLSRRHQTDPRRIDLNGVAHPAGNPTRQGWLPC